MSKGLELFGMVEASQGRAFIGESIESQPLETILVVAKNSLEATLETADILREFIWENTPPVEEESRKGVCPRCLGGGVNLEGYCMNCGGAVGK